MKELLKTFYRFVLLLVPIAIIEIIAFYAVNADTLSWYSTLHKPFFTPPSWVFGAVWPVLYFLMTIAACIVAQRRTLFSKPLRYYYLQLLCNGAYTPLFFGCHSPLSGLVATLTLLIILIPLTQMFFKENKIAGTLLIPYVVWTLFASFLGLGVFLAN